MDIPEVASLPPLNRELKEVRDPISTLLRCKWHCHYFLNTLLFNFFGKTRLFPHAHGKYSPDTHRNKLTGFLKDRLNQQIHEIGAKTGPGQVLELPRVRDISAKDLYRDYIVPNKPVVLEGAAKEWEVNLPKIVYQRRDNYFGQWASFAHFAYTKTVQKLGLSRQRAA